jgi:formylglycine-generating enzyme required for sulfatase activity
VTVAVRATPDAYVGLDAPSEAAWDAWHRSMLAERDRVLGAARFDPAVYDDADTAWSDATFRQLFLFLYDTSFYDAGARRYRTRELVATWKARFGRVDEVLLWHAYPRLGFDARTQFDFYRQLPGGLERLRADVCDVLHASGIRVLVDYNPWDAGSHDELAEIVAALDADGVMLDTMTDVPADLARAVRGRRRGVVFAPELRMKDADLRHARQSWAQWCDVGDASTPSIYRSRWLVPRHRPFAIARWDRSRRRDVVYAFFNGAGLVLWENVFGCWNPYAAEDRRLVAETAAVIDHYGDVLARGAWRPLVPTGVPGLDANRFEDAGSGRIVVTFRNRTDRTLAYTVPDDAPAGLEYVAFWGVRRAVGRGDTVPIEPNGTQALVLDAPDRASNALEHFVALGRDAGIALPADADPRRPPRRVAPQAPVAAPVHARPPAGAASSTRMVPLAGGAFPMHVEHERRESGCYAPGTPGDVTWGWFYRDVVAHDVDVLVAPFAIRATAVTNAEFLAFVRRSGYRPHDPERFLAHLPRAADGSLVTEIPAATAALPVTHVSLADARAFAAFEGHRLPTEGEWQWAAEGAGAGNRFPWGEEDRQASGALGPADDPATATPQGVRGLAGNAWELTESEHSDGHTRFVMLRGGAFLRPGASEWLVARGVRPNRSHAKYVLLADGVDRSEAISFRTVRPP